MKLQQRMIVLDPFMGSGSGGLAAYQLGFDYIGIDDDEESIDTACRRLDEATRQQDLFKT